MSAVLEKIGVVPQPFLRENPKGLAVRKGNKLYAVKVTTLNFSPVVAIQRDRLI